MRRKVCVITGSRADYGIFFPILKSIESSNSLRLSIIATSMHLMEEFGYTVKDIRRDGFSIYEKVNISYRKDTGQAMADSCGRAVSKFSRTFSRLRPDIVVILGDRGEMLAAAIAANYINIPVAHIHGGEVSGHIDEVMRHAITKISHIHFASTANARKRILKLGEEPGRVFVVGAPALDRILNGRLPDKDGLFKKYKLSKRGPLIILIQHPVMAQINEAERQIRITLDALKGFGVQTVVIYPNSDAGGRKMIRAIREYERLPFIRPFSSIPHEDYLGLMKASSALIGNSSSGIIEAPSFKLPVVNIGIRQQGRERSINVIDVGHDKNAIIAAVKKCLYDKRFKERLKSCRNIYGDGHAGRRIVKVLSSIVLDNGLLKKRITY